MPFKMSEPLWYYLNVFVHSGLPKKLKIVVNLCKLLLIILEPLLNILKTFSF
jgi:hypothetical protein